MSLVLDLGQGAGTAGATGVRPVLPPLLVGVLARSDAGIDFDGTDYAFLEDPAFLLGVLVLGVILYMTERSAPNRVALGLGAVSGAVLGALLFAGALADGGHSPEPGLVAGVGCALLGFAAATSFLTRVRTRLDEGAAGLLGIYTDVAALALTALSIFLPPAGFVALAVFVWLLVVARREGGRRVGGLRVLGDRDSD